MEHVLKVLMMGGQRVGKSSALAAVMDAFMKAPINKLLQVEDSTELVKCENEKQESISQKLYGIKASLLSNYGRTILVDSGKTSTIWNYKLELSLPDSNKKMEIIFTDVNGEFYEGGNIRQEEICKLIEEYDVFIIAADTTYLMESINKGNEYVDDIINEKYNYVDDIHDFLSSINSKNNSSAKLVVFTPIKCEKWAHENALDKVVERTKQVYKTAIAGLKAHDNIVIEFLPIQTVGSMIFKEHLPASLFVWTKTILLFFNKTITQKCSIINTDKVRLSNGKEMFKSAGYIEDDYSAVLVPGSDIRRPNSWFEVKSSEYAPHNCEQLALHILDFMLRKMIDAKIREEKAQNILVRGTKKVVNVLLDIPTFGLWSEIKGYFGTIPLEKMERILSIMKSNDIIKYSGEGIEVYKDIDLLTK